MSPSVRALAASLTCAAMAAACTYRPPKPAPPVVIRYAVSSWLLEARTDPFTRVRTCRISDRRGWSPDVVATPTVFTFRFARRLDTSDAWYRIGDAPPRPWRDLTSQLIAAGALAEAERLDNPSGGAVAIPEPVLAGADAITIRPVKGVRPRRFDLHGAWPLLHAAETLSCRF